MARGEGVRDQRPAGAGAGAALQARDPVARLPGAGPKTVARLAAAGIVTVGDLLALAPRGYDDLRAATPVAALPQLSPGQVVVVRGVVRRVHVFPRRFLDVTVDDGGATLRARWFRAPGGMARAFPKGESVALAGALRFGADGRPELIHPLNVTAAPPGIRARYPLIDGVGGRVLEKMIAAALAAGADTAGAADIDYVDDIDDVLPAGLRARCALPGRGQTWRALHLPDAGISAEALAALRAGRSPAHRRLALEELFILQVGFRARRASAGARPARPCNAVDGAELLAAARARLPFALTAGQANAVTAIAADLASPRPMQRLLCGDVGSGKTVVALLAAVAVAAAGGQTLLMAPTEVLAEQHRRTLAAVGGPF
ncbi:MAG TPA: DEAD/DEAH box helicase, partial [Polyangia bacterium]|nr:DEAD/DEAH box helicase [Polyangia bacterium]